MPTPESAPEPTPVVRDLEVEAATLDQYQNKWAGRLCAQFLGRTAAETLIGGKDSITVLAQPSENSPYVYAAGQIQRSLEIEERSTEGYELQITYLVARWACTRSTIERVADSLEIKARVTGGMSKAVAINANVTTKVATVLIERGGYKAVEGPQPEHLQKIVMLRKDLAVKGA